jgi:DNA mismatch repair protein MutL
LSAVKAGDPLSLEQAQRLLDDLAEVWSPATCPHGRPALVSISMEELARRFGRS